RDVERRLDGIHAQRVVSGREVAGDSQRLVVQPGDLRADGLRGTLTQDLDADARVAAEPALDHDAGQLRAAVADHTLDVGGDLGPVHPHLDGVDLDESDKL